MKSKIEIWLLSAGVVLILLSTCSFLNAQENENQPSDVSGEYVLESDVVLFDDIQMAEDLRPVSRGPVTGFRYWTNFFTALILVIFFIWLVAWGFRLIFSKLPGYAGRDDFRVINSIKMTAQSSIFIIRVMNVIYVLSVTPQNVNLIDRIDDPEQIKDLINSVSENPDGINPHSFGTIFQRRVSEIVSKDSIVIDRQKGIISQEKGHFKDTLDRLKSYDDEDESSGGEWKA